MNTTAQNSGLMVLLMAALLVIALPRMDGGRPSAASERRTVSRSQDRRQAEDEIAWGRVARPVQLGWRVEPKKETYAIGDVVSVTLFLRNTGRDPIQVAMPNLEVLEKLGLDLDFDDSENANLPWQWGSAHRDREKAELTVSGALKETLEPGAVFELPSFQLAIGELHDAKASKSMMAQLDLREGKNGRVTFKLSSIGIARADKEHLESAAFEFRVRRPGN
ncbi:MAG TPA: hypothetical protein VND64_19790 [Pirellulales bacterium]|nr:hypothetical protein [Pirellulales bacterium]